MPPAAQSLSSHIKSIPITHLLLLCEVGIVRSWPSSPQLSMKLISRILNQRAGPIFWGLLFFIPAFYLFTPSILFINEISGSLVVVAWMGLFYLFVFKESGRCYKLFFSRKWISIATCLLSCPLWLIAFMYPIIGTQFPINIISQSTVLSQKVGAKSTSFDLVYSTGCDQFIDRSTIVASGRGMSGFQSLQVSLYCFGRLSGELCSQGSPFSFASSELLAKTISNNASGRMDQDDWRIPQWLLFLPDCHALYHGLAWDQ